MKETTLARQQPGAPPTPPTPDPTIDPVTDPNAQLPGSDVTIVTRDQVEGIDQAPPETLERARVEVVQGDQTDQDTDQAEQFTSEAHIQVINRLEAIVHRVNREERHINHRKNTLHQAVRFFLDMFQGIKQKKAALNEIDIQAAQWKAQISKTQPDMLPSVAAEVDRLQQRLEAIVDEPIADLPIVDQLPVFPSLDQRTDLAERKHALLKYCHDVVQTLREYTPKDAREKADLVNLQYLFGGAIQGVQNAYNEKLFSEQVDNVKKLTQRFQLEHSIPEALSENSEFSLSVDFLKDEIAYWQLNERITAHEKYYNNINNTEILDGSESDIQSIRTELIQMFNRLAQQRDNYPLSFFQRISDRIIETHLLIDKIRQRERTGAARMIETQATSTARYFVMGSEAKFKSPKKHEPDITATEWNDDLEYPLNDLGEDRVIIDPEIHAMIVGDGNGTYDNSADAVRRLTKKLHELFQVAAATHDPDQAVVLLNSRLGELPEALQSMEADGGATLYGTLYFPDQAMVVTFDLGDAEGYRVRDSKITRLEPSVDPTEKTSSQAAGVYKDTSGPARIIDNRKTKLPFVRKHSIQPGDIVVIQTDGPRNNLPKIANSDADVQQVVEQLIEPLQAGGQPNVEALPNTLGYLGFAGDDEVVAVQQFM